MNAPALVCVATCVGHYAVSVPWPRHSVSEPPCGSPHQAFTNMHQAYMQINYMHMQGDIQSAYFPHMVLYGVVRHSPVCAGIRTTTY